jgi:hypothetical protein
MTYMKSCLVASLFCLAALLLPATLRAQITFERTYGGTVDDLGYAVQQAPDSGYIIAGQSGSYGAGGMDVYAVSVDFKGDTLWTRTFGGTAWDEGRSVQPTADGGYIIAGWTLSFGAGGSDVYLIKTDTHGDTLWTRTFGGTGRDYGFSVQQTADDGFIIAGSTHSYGAGLDDVYLVKTDADGDTIWTRTYGGSTIDEGWSVQQTADSGYIIAGCTKSFGAGWYDVYVIKTDSRGDTLWTRTYGGASDEGGYSIRQTADGGYIVAGETQSFGSGGTDVYLVRTNGDGDTVWTRTFGGTSIECGFSVQQTVDGGYIVAGETRSQGAGASDVYLIRTDANGDTLWTKVFGDSSYDWAGSVQQTPDGGYIVAGLTESYGAGGRDFYLIKTDSLGRTAVEEPKVTPTRPSALSLTCEPNPCRGTTRISFKPQASSPKLLTLRLYDTQGCMVLSHQVSTSSFLLSTSDLPSGIYLARLDYGTQHASARLILQR